MNNEESKKEAEKIMMKGTTIKEWLQILLIPVIFTPFAGVVYVFVHMFGLFGDSVPDFFGYGVGPVETFLALGLILGPTWLSFKIAMVVSEFISGLFDKIFK